MVRGAHLCRYESYEPTLKETRERYDLAMKEKMLMRLERDRIAAKVAGLESQVRSRPPPRTRCRMWCVYVSCFHPLFCHFLTHLGLPTT
jgi:hypothetical protein